LRVWSGLTLGSAPYPWFCILFYVFKYSAYDFVLLMVKTRAVQALIF